MPTSTISLIDVINLTQNLAALNLGYLGISVGVISLLAGIGGLLLYFNIKPLKTTLDKQGVAIDDLKKEAKEILGLSRAESTKKIEGFEQEQDKKISDLLKQESEKFDLKFRQQIAEFDRDLSEKLGLAADQNYNKLKELLQSEIDNKSTTIEKFSSELINKSKNEFEEKIVSTKKTVESMNLSLKDLKRKIKELELEEFARKNLMGAIYRAIDLLKDDIDDDKQRLIPADLERLKKEIKGCRLNAEDVTLIEAQLTRLDSDAKYKTLITKVRSEILYKGDEAKTGSQDKVN